MDALRRRGRDQLQDVHGLPGRVLRDRRRDPPGHAAGAPATARTIMMHAENGIAIDVLVAQALAAGHTDPGYHGRTRPPELEGEATTRAIRLAQVAGAPLYIVHLSAEQALDAVTEARDEGRNVFAETCPQYLYLSQDDLDAPDFEGAKYVCLAAGAAARSTGSTCGGGCAPTTCRSSPPTTARSASRSRRSWAAATSPRSRTASRGRAPDGPAAPGRGGRRAVARALGRGELDHARPGCSASTRARAPSPPARTPTS